MRRGVRPARRFGNRTTSVRTHAVNPADRVHVRNRDGAVPNGDTTMRMIATLLWLLLAPAAASADPGSEELVIRTADGAEHAFRVELALTPEQQARGLMFRETLARDEGMLFHWPREQSLAMWMKNTLIPLDMLFLRSDGTIMHIHRRAVPLSTRTIRAPGRGRGVLELRGGTADRLGIAVGDRVVHRLYPHPR